MKLLPEQGLLKERVSSSVDARPVVTFYTLLVLVPYSGLFPWYMFDLDNGNFTLSLHTY